MGWGIKKAKAATGKRPPKPEKQIGLLSAIGSYRDPDSMPSLFRDLG